MDTYNELKVKYDLLQSDLKEMRKLAVAFSGGVDSTFLLYAAKEALGDDCIALTAKSILMPGYESEEAVQYTKDLGVRHIIIDHDPMTVEGFSGNPKDRCYICKRALFEQFKSRAMEEGYEHIAEGSNVDDDGDYRPGHRAIAELGIKSPLRKAGLTKSNIRALSKQFGLPTWDKSSFACLASRIPYGEPVTAEKLSMIEKAEGILREMGFKQYRVRAHGTIARIELLPEDFERFMQDEVRNRIYDALKALGFTYVTLDIHGFESGSLNL